MFSAITAENINMRPQIISECVTIFFPYVQAFQILYLQCNVAMRLKCIELFN